MVSAVCLTCVIVVALSSGGHGYGRGSGRSACHSMRVGHGSLQLRPSPYDLSLPDTPTTYSARNQVKVCIHGSEIWRGALVQARRVGDANPVGTWSSDLPRNTRLMKCSKADDSVTHSDSGNKDDNSCFLWNPPATPSGDVFFLATIAASKNVWWMNHTTAVLSPEADYGVPPPTVPGSVTPASTLPSGDRHDHGDSSEEDEEDNSREGDEENSRETGHRTNVDDSDEEEEDDNNRRSDGNRHPEGDRRPNRDGHPEGDRQSHGDGHPEGDRQPHGDGHPEGDRQPHGDGHPEGDRRPNRDGHRDDEEHEEDDSREGGKSRSRGREHRPDVGDSNDENDDNDRRPHGDTQPHTNRMSHGDRQRDEDKQRHDDRQLGNDRERNNNKLSQGHQSFGGDSYSKNDELSNLVRKQTSAYVSSSSVISHCVALLTATFVTLRFVM